MFVNQSALQVAMKYYKAVVVLLCCLVQALGQDSGGNDVLTYTLQEEVTLHKYIGNVFTDASLESKYDPDVLPLLRYGFLNLPKEAEFLQITENDGTLRTKGRVDRDSICPGQDECVVNVNVAIRPNAHIRFVSVKITIEDLNDNSPSFSIPRITREIPESSSIGTTILLPLASDPDSGSFGVQRYALAQGSAQFDLENQNPTGGNPIVQLVLRQTLDLEKVSTYQVSVLAYDGEGKTGTLVVDIVVTDSNDHAPNFPRATYTVNVPESMPVNSTLTTLRAVDGDTGIFGKLSYKLNVNPEDVLAKMFSLDADSGNLILRQALDYDTMPANKKYYELPVSATDAGPNTQPATAAVVVNIQDVNDNAPKIHITVLSDPNITNAEISESSKNGTFVAHASVSDEDSGNNGLFTCSVDNHRFKLEKIPGPGLEGQYKIVLATKVDHETQAQHQLTVTCLDHGKSPQTSSRTLSVDILDENDNSPQFSKPIYRANITENNQIDTPVIQVTATDADTDSRVSYGLQPESAKYFSINSQNGEIRAMAVFDYETTKKIDVGVIAHDQGKPARTSTAIVHVTILDVNDHAPEFIEENYMFDILESRLIGSEVGITLAVDRDSSLYNNVEYSIYPSSAAMIFDIDSESGQIRTLTTLDRESQVQYYFTVVAKNTDQTPPRSGTAMVTVTVLDENDNNPIIEYPGVHNHTVNISSHVPVGYEVAIIDAYDQDEGENAKLSYTITGGNDNSAFVIGSDTGLVSTNSRLDNWDKQIFELQVAVADHGSPQRISSAIMHIRVDSSIPYLGQVSSFLSGPNLTIVISLSVVCGIIVIILLVAICIMRNQEQRKRGQAYRSRLQALQVIADKNKNSSHSQTSNGDINKNVANGNKNQSNGNINSGDAMSKVNKKEVTFSMMTEGSKNSTNSQPVDCIDAGPTGQRQSWPSSTCHSTQVNAGRSNSVRVVDPPRVPASFAGQTQRNPNARSVSPQPHPSGSMDPTTQKLYELSVRHLQSQQWFDEVKADRDADSSCSNVSNTDSGRGPSEEGENLNHSNASNPGASGTGASNGGRKLLHLQEVALNSRRDPQQRGSSNHKPGCYPHTQTGYKSHPANSRVPNNLHGRTSKPSAATLSKDSSVYSTPVTGYDNPAFSRSMSQRGHRDNSQWGRQLGGSNGMPASYRNSCRGGLAPVHPSSQNIYDPYVRREKSGILYNPVQRTSGTSDGSSSHRDSSGSTTSGSYVVDPSEFGLKESEVADFSAVVV